MNEAGYELCLKLKIFFYKFYGSYKSGSSDLIIIRLIVYEL